ncbi:alpha-L-fucosidase [Aestuariibaculum suncheonense]|uniref:alpha-L-fucosidase n=1 Tax=Aestuariibaculum suncheonense TaxID=1028745 RepID=A0A8J6QER7_9FLAO|nr:alpha-L-fucosidase [Aestuariibaculum suncheonense]MBD0835578.1 alpha-L-fucosidase [Aestuariibaculum suncheonense]
MRVKELFVAYFFISVLGCKEVVAPPEKFGLTPSEKQLNWHNMEYYAFVHFSLNTFTNKEWGYGDESPELFNPTELDTRQWARVVKEAGMKGIILTAKHHDGFCLWPSQYTERSVKNSPWKDGKGDVVKELAEACKEYGLKLGIYLSPWDRNHPGYGKPEYITYFRNQLKELLTNYGDVFEMWFDGANGGDGYYGGANEIRKINTLEYYDWDETYKMIYNISPNTLVWGIGPSEARWIGNERGRAGKTNWCLLRQKDELAGKVHYSEFMNGHEDGEKWVPGEADVSIRPGWFYHESEDSKVRPLKEMVDIYYESIGRNANLLLNLPVDKRGLVNENDIARLKELTAVIQADFKDELLISAKVSANHIRGNSNAYGAENLTDNNKETYWATNDSINTGSVLFEFEKPTTLNRIELQEYIALGQRVKAFNVEAYVDEQWQTIANETTIGYKRILRTPRVTTKALRINFTDAKSSLVISAIKAYNAPILVGMPNIRRNKNGVITMEAEKGHLIYYTTDGTEPNQNSQLFKDAINLPQAVTIKALAYNPEEHVSSKVKTINYGKSKAKWKVISTHSAESIIDGDRTTTWTFRGINSQLQQEIIVDMGELSLINGFSYFPKQTGHNLYLISKYAFYTSTDKMHWIEQSQGEFSNIENNPVEQIKMFEKVNARYLKFIIKQGVKNESVFSIAELDVIDAAVD